MQNSATSSVARPFAVSPEMAPFLPELMTDLNTLGVPAYAIVQLLRSLRLTPEFTRVLDLGCGKGVVACAVAEALNFSVLGVDALPVSIAAASRLAAARGLSNICSFRCEDIRTTVANVDDYDVVMLLAVGSIWGSLEKTVAAIRHCLRPGGYMLIADAFWATERDIADVSYADHRHTLGQLTAYGDILLEEVLLSPAQMIDLSPGTIRLITQRAEKLAQLHPENANQLTQFVASLKQRVQFWHEQMKVAVWLMMKGVLIADR
ncbi:MAG: class I SAM-dependent methyltransferase [candidate division KSB1 bacterium]|nr:class I SAM-dependent methyltransferase [candidate division KSB1 bacterium]MDZ7342391.1 class I SAM-dependent methyltransferase [candidate division KSB1 bacterium]